MATLSLSLSPTPNLIMEETFLSCSHEPSAFIACDEHKSVSKTELFKYLIYSSGARKYVHKCAVLVREVMKEEKSCC
jgi:hypothetical protein